MLHEFINEFRPSYMREHNMKLSNIVNVSELGQNLRLRILKYVTETKGVPSRELGITPSYLNMLKHSKRRTTEDLTKNF